MNRESIIGEWHRAVQSLGAAEVLMRSDYREDSPCLDRITRFSMRPSHSAVRGMFGLHLVRTGEIERRWASDLGEGLDDRLTADYNVISPAAKPSLSMNEGRRFSSEYASI